jgi:hypothetical protein
MALNFYLDKIADYETVCWDKDDKGRMRWATETIIFATMGTGVPHLKDEAACKLFYTRFIAHCRAANIYTGAFDALKYDTVLKHIGLSTNASSLTPTAFSKQLARTALETAESTLRMELMENS